MPWRKNHTDRLEDVADQPGLKRALVGIGVAVLLGIFFRTAFSAEAISEQLRLAAANVHAGLKIDFESADLSLADGPFPEFAVVVHNVNLESNDVCWLSPVAKVDELRLPLNIWALIQGRVEISEVKLGQVQLELRNSAELCKQKQTEESSPVAKSESQTPSTSSAAVPLFEAPETRGPISKVSVHGLQVQYTPLPNTGFDIDRLEIERLSEVPLQVRMRGELNLGGATLSGDYSSSAKFDISYAHPEVNIALHGTWREGSYNLTSQLEVEKKLLGLQGRIDHLPLSQILPVLKKYGLLKGEYDGRQIWLNLKLKTPELSAWEAGLPLDIEEIGIEGDLGQIEGRSFHIRKWKPLEFENTEIRLRGLQVEKLLRLFGQTEKPKSMGSLGELNAVLRIETDKRFHMTGEYSGLEFIFSNRGERKTQGIALMTGVLKYDDGDWELDIDKMRPHEGLFLGDIHLQGSARKRETQLRVHIEEAHLRPEVQALMSGGGSLGRWAGDISAKMLDQKLHEISGQLVAQDLEIDGVALSQIRGQLETHHAKVEDRLEIDLKARDISVVGNSPARRLIDPLVRGLASDAAPAWNFPQMQMRLDVKGEEGVWNRLGWSLKPAQSDQILLSSEGGWNDDGRLYGQVRAKNRGKESRWRLGGQRDAPVLIQDERN